MRFYTEVEKDRKPKNRIDFCFKCRIIELYREGSDKFRRLDNEYRELFRSYLLEDSKVPESRIRDVLRNADIDFKLMTPTYLVHKWGGETFSRDIISGIMSGRYDGKSSFGVISKHGKVQVYEHTISGYHMMGNMLILVSNIFTRWAYNLIVNGHIDISEYGEGFLDCILICYGKELVEACCYILRGGDIEFCSPEILKMHLLRNGIGYSFDTMCNAAATDLEVFLNIIFSCRHALYYLPYGNDRNLVVAQNCLHIHPDHRRVGLNLIDILMLLNPNIHDFNHILNPLGKLLLPENGDLSILIKSLKFWLENVQNEKEFELIQNRVEILERLDVEVKL